MQAGFLFFSQDCEGTAFGQGTVSACAGPKEKAAIIIKRWLLQRGSTEDTAEDVLETLQVAMSSRERTATVATLGRERFFGLNRTAKN